MKAARAWPIAAIAALAAAGIVAFALSTRYTNGPGAGATPTADAEAPIVVTGLANHTTEPFFLEGGTYHATWSAWGETPSEPPCTHSMDLISIAADGSAAQAANLAAAVQVPATGTTAEIVLVDLDPGDYYLQIASACAWQVELSQL